MADKPKRELKRGRIRNAADAEEQTLDLEAVKRALRKGKGRGKAIVDSDDKSIHRFKNKLREIKDGDDAIEQFR